MGRMTETGFTIQRQRRADGAWVPAEPRCLYASPTFYHQRETADGIVAHSRHPERLRVVPAIRTQVSR